MSAEGFCIGVGGFLSDAARAYFKKYGRLAPQNLAIGSVTTITGAETLENLLTAIKNSKQSSFLVYAHGQPDGSGLYLRFATRRGSAAGSSATATNLEILMRLNGREKPPWDRELGILGLTKPEAQNLLDLMTDVRAKKIDTIEFRGCNLGKKPDSVQTFKKFFGATTFGAPDLYSFFGSSPVYIGQKYVNEYRDHRPKFDGTWEDFTYTFTNPSGTLVNSIGVNADLKPAAGLIVADSQNTVQRWMTQYIDANGTYAVKEGNLILHGMWDRGQKKIDPKEMDGPIGTLVKLPSPTLLMPLESDFKSHVIYK